MSWSSTAASILQSSAAEPPKPDSIARAEELIKLITSPTAVATVILIGFARSQLDKNASGYVLNRTVYALLAAAAAVVITAVIVGVMLPLSIRILHTNEGPVDTTLVVYALTHLVASGTAAYAVKVCAECIREIRSH
jgi:hypothetical protein